MIGWTIAHYQSLVDNSGFPDTKNAKVRKLFPYLTIESQREDTDLKDSRKSNQLKIQWKRGILNDTVYSGDQPIKSLIILINFNKHARTGSIQNLGLLSSKEEQNF